MNKDKLTPQQIGKVFLEILKLEAKRYINTIINDIVALVDPKPQVDLKHIKDELVYLNIYIIYQALFNRFKLHFDEIEGCFKKELEQFLEEQTSEEFALISMINVNNAIIDYMKQHNNTIAKEKDHSSGLAQFAWYISRRVWDSNDIRYVTYMSSYYTARITGLIRLIDNSIELISEE